MIGCKSEKKRNQPITNKKVSSYDLGKSLFEGKGKCFSCHKIDKKSIGPSVLEIVKIYNEKKGDMIGFLKNEEKPIVDSSNFSIMKTNFTILETFTDKEIKALSSYMHKISAE